MSAKINPREIYMLERYASIDYFGEIRDTWEHMLKHVERCLESFMLNLDDNYRSRSLPEQPDIVWGNRVLPNFRNTLHSLNTGFILLSHGDVRGLSYANGPLNDKKGQMDYWSGWMAKDDEELYEVLLNRAAFLAHNVVLTEGAYWKPQLPLENYTNEEDSLQPPTQWPEYRVDRNISVRTGEGTIQSGIYVADVDGTCPQFLSTIYKQAPFATVPKGFEDDFHPITGEKSGEHPVFEKRNCIWYLVKRSEEVDGVARNQDPEVLELRKVLAGEACPETGFYFTPAHSGSRRLFKAGEMMPGFDTAYGATIWQWDGDQT